MKRLPKKYQPTNFYPTHNIKPVEFKTLIIGGPCAEVHEGLKWGVASYKAIVGGVLGHYYRLVEIKRTSRCVTYTYFYYGSSVIF